MTAPKPPPGESSSPDPQRESSSSPGEEFEVPPEGDRIAESARQLSPHSATWESRESEVLDLAFSIALEEVKESAKPFEQAKTRAAFLFGATSAAMAFLVGSALRDLDRHSFNQWLLVGGVVSFIVFSAFALLMLKPISRQLYLNGLDVRDRYFRGVQEDVRPSHAWDFARVRWHLIKEASTIVDFNITQLNKLRRYFIGMLLSAAVTLTCWSVLVAYARPGP